MNVPPIELPITFDQAHVRSAYRQLFFWTQLGWILGFALIFCFGIAATVSANKEYAWIGGFFLGLSLLYFYSIFSSWRGVSRSAHEKAGEKMSVRLSETEIRFEGSDFSSTVAWEKLGNAGVLNGNWFLDLSGNYTLLPQSAVTAEADAFIRARLREHRIRLARWSDHPPVPRA